MSKSSFAALLIIAMTLFFIAMVIADSDQYQYKEHEYGEHEEHDRFARSHYMNDVHYALYASECGECHMAYPPAMLPALSWQTIMRNLDDHFGDNAELETNISQPIDLFLVTHAAEENSGYYGRRWWRSTGDSRPPLRITETNYFRAQHHEIPAKLAEDNPEVGSLSRCDACHANADKGNFDEHQVQIPGYGRWDD